MENQDFARSLDRKIPLSPFSPLRDGKVTVERLRALITNLKDYKTKSGLFQTFPIRTTGLIVSPILASATARLMRAKG
jgi:hypothetical protein